MFTSTTQIWAEFHSKLRPLILARVSNSDDNDDILQEVFLTIDMRIEPLRDQDR